MVQVVHNFEFKCPRIKARHPCDGASWKCVTSVSIASSVQLGASRFSIGPVPCLQAAFGLFKTGTRNDRRRSAACSRCWKHRVKAAPPPCRQHSIASRSVGVVLDRMMEVVLLPIWLSSATNACQVGLRVRLRLAAPAESMACPACRSHTRHSAAPRKDCAAVARLPVILEVKATSTQQCPMFNNSLWSRAARGSRSLAGVQRPNAVGFVAETQRPSAMRALRWSGPNLGRNDVVGSAAVVTRAEFKAWGWEGSRLGAAMTQWIIDRRRCAGRSEE